GYDWLACIGGLFVDPAGEAPLTAAWNDLSGSTESFGDVAHRAKHAVMADSLAADLARLTGLFVTVCGRHRHLRDYTRTELATVLEEVLASMPVYRTYVGEYGPAHPHDHARITAALGEAARRRPELDPDLLDALRRVLLAEPPMTGSTEAELRIQFEQFSSPVMAKGVEDTAMYSYCRFIPRNEVGADPAQWATTVGELHAFAGAAASTWPAGLVASSTHDTKRSEDVRARLYLLSEMPERWLTSVERWMGRNARAHRDGFPDRATEYLLYQTLVGAWPISADRAAAYMAKATKEAKVHTNWTDSDPAFDSALESFVRDVLADKAFANDLNDFVETQLLEAGWVNSLAQTLLKLTVPGVPDIYQGCECWDYSLVDPDNRRPVDFGARAELLGRAGSLAPMDLACPSDSGLQKLALTHRALRLRREHRSWLGPGASYQPLTASGPAAGHVVAFCRADSVVTVIPRLVHTLAGGVWNGVAQAVSRALSGTTIALGEGEWVDEMTGDRLGSGVGGGCWDVGELLARFPVALLSRA
ncbi:MAG: malto-oligosyltrehalose synthase, partial [Acidimicrobiales bacterium]